jgi:hypothetical protein
MVYWTGWQQPTNVVPLHCLAGELFAQDSTVFIIQIVRHDSQTKYKLDHQLNNGLGKNGKKCHFLKISRLLLLP